MSVQDILDRAASGLMVEEEKQIPLYVVGNIQITAKEAREVAKENPNHPAAVDLAKAVQSLADDYTVNVEKSAIYAIAKNKKLVEKRVRRDGEEVRIRVLSDDDAEPVEGEGAKPFANSPEEIRKATAKQEAAAGLPVRSLSDAKVTPTLAELEAQAKAQEEGDTTTTASSMDDTLTTSTYTSQPETPDEAANRRQQSDDLAARPASSVERVARQPGKQVR